MMAEIVGCGLNKTHFEVFENKQNCCMLLLLGFLFSPYEILPEDFSQKMVQIKVSDSYTWHSGLKPYPIW